MTFEAEANEKARRPGTTLAVEPLIGFIEALVSSAFCVSIAAIREPGRGAAPVAFARQVAIYLSCTRLGLSFASAGRFFGRDRTTAAHACRTIEDQREHAELDSVLDCLERAIELWICAAADRRDAA